MKKYLILIIFISTVCICFSQNKLSLEIVDSKTKQPIPFCEVVYGKNLGFITNNDGKIAITLGTKPDSITVYNLAYETQTVKLTENQDFYKIFLEPKTYSLPEALIFATPPQLKKFGIFPKGKKGSFGGLHRGHKLALFIANEKEENGIIKNVHFYLRKMYGNPTNTFRVHIYEVDSITEGPGNELLPENIFANAKKGDEWVVVDVEKFQIKFPKEGFFIGIEVLSNYMGDDVIKTKDGNIDTNNIVIGFNYGSPKQYLSWVKSPHVEDWDKLTSKSDYGNFLMGCEIIIYTEH